MGGYPDLRERPRNSGNRARRWNRRYGDWVSISTDRKAQRPNSITSPGILTLGYKASVARERSGENQGTPQGNIRKLSFRSVCGRPERTRINSVGMQCQHLLVKVRSIRCSCHRSAKVKKVTPGFLDVASRAIGVKYPMAGYDCSRMQGFDFIQRSEPLSPCFLIGLRQ